MQNGYNAAGDGSAQMQLREHQTALCIMLEEFDRVCKRLGIPYVLFAGTMLGAVRHQGFVPWDDDLDVMMLRRDYDRFLDLAEQYLDQEKFFLQREFSEHWPMFFSKLRMNNTTCLEKYHPRDPKSHQGIYMDIFPCDNAMDSRLGQLIQFAASKVVIAKSLDRRGYATNDLKKKLFMRLCRCLPRSPFLRIVKGPRRKIRWTHSFLGGARSFNKNVFPRSFFRDRTELSFEGKSYPVSEDYDALLQLLYGDYMTLPPPEERQVKQHAILIDLHNSYEIYEGYRDGMTFDVHTRSIR